MSDSAAKVVQEKEQSQPQEDTAKKTSAIPQGMAKSGRVWKENQKQKWNSVRSALLVGLPSTPRTEPIRFGRPGN